MASTVVHAGVKHTCRIRSTDSLNGANSSCNDCNTPSCWQSKHRNASGVEHTTNVSVRRGGGPQALRVMRVLGARLSKVLNHPIPQRVHRAVPVAFTMSLKVTIDGTGSEESMLTSNSTTGLPQYLAVRVLKSDHGCTFITIANSCTGHRDAFIAIAFIDTVKHVLGTPKRKSQQSSLTKRVHARSIEFEAGT